MKVAATILRLHPKQLFTLSRGTKAQVENVFLMITDSDGLSGLGEASPNAFYGETAHGVLTGIRRCEPFLESLYAGHLLPAMMPDIAGEIWKLARPSRAAQCAIDLALWELMSKRQGLSVSEMVWGHKPWPIPTFLTIAMCHRDDLAGRIQEAAQAKFLKIKVGSATDPDILELVEKSSKARVAIDANGGFGTDSLALLLKIVEARTLEFIEQPFAPGNDLVTTQFRRQTSLPVVADESCVVLEDVERACEQFDGFNIKLVKCGGLTHALQMLEKGIKAGKLTMTGCMLESSLSISAGMVLAQKTDYADLDGAWLLADDPAKGLTLQEGRLSLGANHTGWGVDLPFPELQG